MPFSIKVIDDRLFESLFILDGPFVTGVFNLGSSYLGEDASGLFTAHD
jgi:hypothetical protein